MGLSPKTVGHCKRNPFLALRRGVERELLRGNIVETVNLPRQYRYEATISELSRCETAIGHSQGKQIPLDVTDHLVDRIV